MPSRANKLTALIESLDTPEDKALSHVVVTMQVNTSVRCLSDFQRVGGLLHGGNWGPS